MRDILCLPDSFNKDGYIAIPCSKLIRRMLACGLMGKIHLTLSMSETEIHNQCDRESVACLLYPINLMQSSCLGTHSYQELNRNIIGACLSELVCLNND